MKRRIVASSRKKDHQCRSRRRNRGRGGAGTSRCTRSGDTLAGRRNLPGEPGWPRGGQSSARETPHRDERSSGAARLAGAPGEAKRTSFTACTRRASRCVAPASSPGGGLPLPGPASRVSRWRRTKSAPTTPSVAPCRLLEPQGRGTSGAAAQGRCGAVPAAPSRTASRHSRLIGRMGGIGATSGGSVGAATASLRSVAAPFFMNTL
jgi:hypothetical protein